MKRSVSRKWITSLASSLIITALVLGSGVTVTLAQSPGRINNVPDRRTGTIDTPVHVTEGPEGVTLNWTSDSSLGLTNGFEGWPMADFDGIKAPVSLVTLRITDTPVTAELRAPQCPAPVRASDNSHANPIVDLCIKAVVSKTSAGSISKKATTSAQQPTASITSDGFQINGLTQSGAQAEVAQNLPHLPDAAVTVLRQAYLHGVHIAVVAISPVFQTKDGLRTASQIDAVIYSARVLTPDQLLSISSTSSPYVPENPPPPANPAAFSTSWTIVVASAGIQTVSGSLLQAAGMNLAATSPTNLHLRLNGVEVPLQVISADPNHLTSTDELRFYAPTPGDRWNATQTYWLTVEATAGARMAVRPMDTITAQSTSSAVDAGIYRNYTYYDSNTAGADGDHWFSKNMLSSTPPPSPSYWRVVLSTTLPLLYASGLYTVTGIAYPYPTNQQHMMSLGLGNVTNTVTFTGSGVYDIGFVMPATVTVGNVVLQPQFPFDLFKAETLAWSRPASLDFRFLGATFRGKTGTWAYQLSNLPSGAQLYDVTNRAAPVIVTLNGTQFQEGPNAHDYVLAGPGTLLIPGVLQHAPIDFTLLASTQALYIAPSALQSALIPLLALRQNQGYTAKSVSVQSIYDAWSYGQVSPVSIRSFLRYGTANWFPGLQAVILVGHGTIDPNDYTKTGASNGNVQLIPPYALPVDPVIGETACDTCYAQLNGDDPLSDALPDVLIGRLPVHNAVELGNMITKITNYETAATGTWQNSWRSAVGYLADNFRTPIYSGGTIIGWQMDIAGDFAAASDSSVAAQPKGLTIKRMYYDPYPPTYTGVAWREPNPLTAHSKAVALINAGAAIVNYDGHADTTRLAVTDPSVSPPYLLGLSDIGTLTNINQPALFIQLACLTSEFQVPTTNGGSIDELLTLATNGGAIATWGSSGWSTSYGHDVLQTGFYNALWMQNNQGARLGDLTAAGYAYFFANSVCCQEILRNFLLLGDPLTKLRVIAVKRVYVPRVLNNRN